MKLKIWFVAFVVLTLLGSFLYATPANGIGKQQGREGFGPNAQINQGNGSDNENAGLGQTIREQVRETLRANNTGGLGQQIKERLMERLRLYKERWSLVGKGFAVKEDWSYEVLYVRIVPSHEIQKGNTTIAAGGVGALVLGNEKYVLRNAEKANSTYKAEIYEINRADMANCLRASVNVSASAALSRCMGENKIGTIMVVGNHKPGMGWYGSGDMEINGVKYHVFIS
ncbi:MAG: hypothetical protein QXP42_02800 [Candidatus Micrarchaeia archaeon]